VATITTIDPSKKDDKKKLKVAAYCRVSTGTAEQEESLTAQREHYEDYIKSNPDWQFAGLYYDEAVSGTSTERREALAKMLDDARQGKIDFILTKSISRFSRNKIDCLNMTRELSACGVGIYFEKEGINTLDANGEVLLTILSSLAQQESESLSQNVKLGYQYRFQQGKVNVNYKRFLGYTKGEDGKLEIVPEEAEIVKRIYREYLEGGSTISIAKGLEQDGIKTGAGKTKWQGTTVQKILSNEKYIGDALLQKTVTIDTLQKKRVKNVDHLPQYYVKDDHPAIIPRELFFEVQAEMARRAELRREGKLNKQYSSHIAMSGKVICGECGAPFQRTHWHLKDGNVHVWRCKTRLQHGKKGGCLARTVREEDLQKAVVKAVQDLVLDENSIYNTICSNVQELTTGASDIELDDIKTKLAELQQQVLSRVKAGKDTTELAEKIQQLRDRKNEIETAKSERQRDENRVAALRESIEKAKDKVLTYDEQLVRNFIEEIKVFPDKLTITVKGGAHEDITI
jgi:site-specific DNA recombinase